MSSPLPVSQIIWTWNVPSPTPSKRADVAILDAFAANEGNLAPPETMPLLTRSQLKRLIEEARVTLQGRPFKSNSKLKGGDRVQIVFPAPEPLEMIPEDRPVEVLFEDEYLLVLNKPPGLTVHPSATQRKGTLVHALLHHIQDLSGIGGVLRPGIVHRIDKDTSGALVITKTDETHVKLAEVFAKHQIERQYWAICYGSPAIQALSKTTRIESLMGRHPVDRKRMSMTVKTGRKAITYFKRVEEYSLPSKHPFASWLEVTLETGRTHQIRVHLTGIGHSLLGDPVYGTPSENQPKWRSLPSTVQSAVRELPGQALHARVLGFEHPITKKSLHFEAPPPPHFQKLLEVCRSFMKR